MALEWPGRTVLLDVGLWTVSTWPSLSGPFFPLAHYSGESGGCSSHGQTHTCLRTLHEGVLGTVVASKYLGYPVSSKDRFQQHDDILRRGGLELNHLRVPGEIVNYQQVVFSFQLK